MKRLDRINAPNGPSTVLLLLSGGKDSRLALLELLQSGHHVVGLCIDGHQGQEKVGAQKTAQEFGIQLIVKKIKVFDETTWNPAKLIFRDILMGFIAIYYAKRSGAKFLATGVLKADVINPKLSWLSGFLKFAEVTLGILGIKLIFPVWSNIKIAENPHLSKAG